MHKYRKTLYENYYSTHSGKTDVAIQQSHFDQQVRYFKWEFGNHLPTNKSIAILDIGCGFGSLIKALNELGYNQTTGIDLSPEQVKMAEHFGVKNIQQADAHDFLQNENAKFDVIFAVDLIEHLSKDELVDFLQRLKSGLKPGGKIILRTPNMDAPLAGVFAFADFTHEVFLNKASAMQLLHSVGFTKVAVSEGIMYNESPIKEFVRKIGWFCTRTWLKAMLFFSARTWDEVVFSPNIVVEGESL
ncbi:MAG: class I SAM-dependent methyltransferase [Flavobacteriales bacterium]|nr:class I SAM-dependent methyltransferase [Flavobacteriales bacterium]